MATPMEGTVEDADQPEASARTIPGYSDANEFSQKALRSVLMATRGSNNLPVGDDYDFYSTFGSVRDVLDIEGQRILTLLKRLLRSQNIKGNISHGDTVEIDDHFDVIMDANDQILERAGSLLDEASGIKKEETKLVIASVAVKQTKTPTSWNKKMTAGTAKSPVSYSLMTARNIQRPQLRFKDKIDNSNLPFKPQIRTKPNAIQTLEESLKLPEGVQPEDTEKPDFNYPNPYQAEIEAFTPSPERLQRVKPQEAKPMSLTPLMMIETEQQLADMMADLSKQTEIAVDLEHHSYRSFQGITCLMQVSTRSRDYIVDTLELRSQLPLLNDVFTDPAIVKVLHGADSDVGWLQRDFGVYLVNMFDTGQAARVLGLPRFSLAYLLASYCQVDADKQFQLADWRIRPLPAELINYAREDTHFLLYIYDMMRNQLLERGNTTGNLLTSVYERSKSVATKVFQKPPFHKEHYLELYKKSKKAFNNQQLSALRDLYAWRDAMARAEDESLGYVLPNHMLLQMAEILPRERQGMLACCSPVPPLVRQSLVELHNMVMQARELPLVKVEQRPVVQPSSHQHPMYQMDSLLECPHDQSHTAEMQRSPEPGLLAETSSLFRNQVIGVTLKSVPIISAYGWKQSQSTPSYSSARMVNKIRASFSNPFSKFMPKEMRDDQVVESSDVWRMKASTVKPSAVVDNSKKRKAVEIKEEPIDLDSFEPEFVPPSKRVKAAVPTNLTASTSTQAAAVASASSTSGSIFRVPDSAALVKPGSSVQASVGAGKALAQTVEKRIKSLRDEVTAKKKKSKKEKKAKLKAEKLSELQSCKPTIPPTDTDNNSSSINNNSNSSLTSTALKPPTTPPSEPPDLEIPRFMNSKADPLEAKKEKKKAKKKKKLTMEEVEQNFTAFDYPAAEKALEKQNKQKKDLDIFNPALPSRSGKDKNKAKKPKLSGAHSNKLVSFGPSTPGQGGKRKKK